MEGSRRSQRTEGHVEREQSLEVFFNLRESFGKTNDSYTENYLNKKQILLASGKIKSYTIKV